MKTYQKILLGLFSGILLLFLATYLYTSFYLEDHLKTKLITEINNNSNGKYELTISTLSLRFLNRQIELEGMAFKTTEGATQQVHVDVHSISLSGIGVLQLLVQRNLSIQKIHIENPRIDIKQDLSESAGSNTKNFIERAAKASGKVLSNLSIPELTMSQMDVEIARLGEENAFLLINHADIFIHNLSLDSTDSTAGMLFDDIEASINSATFLTKNNLYSLQGDSIEFSSNSEMLSVKGTSFTPLYNETDFFETVGFRTDRIEATSSSLTVEGMDVEELFQSGSLIVKHVSVMEPDIRVFRNKKYPQRENRSEKPLPQQMLKGISIPVMIENIQIDRGYVQYSELEEHAKETGYVEFANLDAIIKNTSNIDSLAEKNTNWTLDAETLVMNKALLDVSFQFPINERSHTVTGQLSQMDATELNHALVPIAAVQIDSGEILNMHFEMRLGPADAIGSVEVIYDDLKISLLDEGSGEENLRSRLTSFFANTFKIKENNPADAPQIGDVSYEREPEKSFFNYWWKSLQSGIKSSIEMGN